jgi:2-methylcitrate dehydratase PrpD
VTASGAAQGIANFAASLSSSLLPDDVVRAVKRHVLDAIGVALAASGTGAVIPIVDAVKAWGGTRESAVIGSDAVVPAPAAALANGALIHALDFDDTHIESVVHPSSVVVPAALAVAQEAGASGRDLVTACAIGYEVAARIGAAAPGRFHARGFHPTGLVGPFVAAVVAGRLWGSDAAELANGLGIAGSQASGLFAALDDGTETKRFHPGWAAHAGVVAADLARRGFTGPRTVFEGQNGFFPAFLAGERPDLSRLLRGLGYEWETTRIAIKPYPACHFVHAYMDAARRTRARAGDVDEVVCAVASPTVGIVCEPRAEKVAPSSAYSARFSLPFAVAVALVGGRTGLELFDEDARADRRVLALAERVRYEVDDTLPFPKTYGGRLTVIWRDGRERTVEELVNRGHPDRPLTDDEVRAKFASNARKRLDEAAADKLAATLDHLEELDGVEDVVALMQAP